MRCPNCNTILRDEGRSSLVANDNTSPLPTPLEFSTLLAQFLSAARAESPDYVELEALRMKLIESYDRAFEAR